MKKILFLVALLPSLCQAQDVNDLVKIWLDRANISASDFVLCDPAPIGVIGTGGICKWGDDLGAQPTPDQLLALTSIWGLEQQALQYADVAAQGVQISCADGATICSAGLAGTYTTPLSNGAPTNSAAQQNINSVETSIAAGRGLPGGGSSFAYFDAAGTAHQFTVDQWGEFAQALMNYSYALQITYSQLKSGQSVSWPSNQLQLQ